MTFLFLNPPVVKPCEPPPGLARIVGTLRGEGIRCKVIDANAEGLLWLMRRAPSPCGARSARALAGLGKNLGLMRNGGAFGSIGRYIKTVLDIDHVLELAGRRAGYTVGLADLRHDALSPLRSSDLVHAADHPEENVFYPFLEERILHALDEVKPDVFGVSLSFLSQALCAFASIGIVRRHAPGLRIVLGGSLVTSWARGPGTASAFSGLVDEVVEGPGEARLLELAGLGKGSVPLRYDFSPFNDEANLSPRPVIPVSCSTGCYWNRCSFCPERAEGHRYRPNAPQEVLGQVDVLARGRETPLVHFTDNAMSPSLLEHVARSGRTFSWYGFARFTPHLADADFCRALSRSGCVMLQLGLESGDQDVLDSLDKGISLQTAARSLVALKESGIGTYVYLLFGTPQEDEDSARKTLAFIEAHAHLIDFLNLSIFNLPRGSREALELETYDFFEGDLSLYTGFVHPKGWDRRRVRRFLDREFRRNEAVGKILRNSPPVFTSNHAPFFLMERRRQDLRKGA
ncbi:MAG TPA: radical SAM protein [Deltaproteobacteria bacterium]|nr:radical SAM protein [Deltaproteobacteria bacterium]HOM29980.1 radical SAM protein [Deltaproteobacteria bacterium]HPP80769.1 radical SAM protein [Deltaproteobacteria bacterium]